MTTLFLDIGGVILTNGWGQNIRKKVIDTFSLEEEEFTKRHKLIFDTFEIGKLTFEEYLQAVIFYKKRNFSLEEVKNFAYHQAISFPETIQFLKNLKEKYHLKIAAVTNEGKGLVEDRVKRFGLKSFIDFFIISSHVGLRKPDLDIYRLALGISQSEAHEVLYLDDRELLVEQANTLGIQGICHVDLTSTMKKIEEKFSEKLILH